MSDVNDEMLKDPAILDRLANRLAVHLGERAVDTTQSDVNDEMRRALAWWYLTAELRHMIDARSILLRMNYNEVVLFCGDTMQANRLLSCLIAAYEHQMEVGK